MIVGNNAANFILRRTFCGRVIAQAVSGRPVISEARVRARISACLICDGQSGTGAGFSPSSSVLSCQYHSTMALNTHISFGG
jgi:hypothetical protein